MSVLVACPFCSKNLTIKDQLVGKKIRCPDANCKNVFVAQAKESATAEASSETLVVECGECSAKLRVRKTLAGKRIRCTKCQAVIAIPETEASSSADFDTSPMLDQSQDTVSSSPSTPPQADAECPFSRAELEEEAEAILAKSMKRPGFFARLLGKGTPQPTSEQRKRLREVAFDHRNAELRYEVGQWLRKKGNPQGDFICVTSLMDWLPDDHDLQGDLDDRWSDLIDTHGKGWFKGLKGLGLVPELIDTFFPALWMEDGFIHRVELDKDTILPAKAKELFAAAPSLREIEFHSSRAEPTFESMDFVDLEHDLVSIFELPQMEQITALSLQSLQIGADEIDALVNSSMTQLEDLDLGSNQVGDEGAELLASAKSLSSLRSLNLGSCDIGPAGIEALAKSPHLKNLERLDLAYNPIGPEGATALANSPYLHRLQELRLTSCELGGEGVAALANSSILSNLTTLELDSNELTSKETVELLESKNLTKVEKLSLSCNEIGSAVLVAIAGSARWGQLRELDLGSAAIDGEGAKALAGSAHVKNLVELNLGCNPIGDEAGQVLASSPNLAKLTNLILSFAELGPATAKTIAASKHLQELTSLQIGDNKLGPKGAMAFVKSTTLSNLEHLYLENIEAGDEAEEALLDRFDDALNL